MSNAVIQIDSLGKCYRIGAGKRASHRTLRDTLAAAPRHLMSRIREGHTRTESFWALRDVNLDIEQGDIVAFVGRNGAGKSTLLRILSRIVEPTTGKAVLHGRVSSLLEVGTGFHTELTGRENIFLNGAVLGMRRTEIRARFDEIVEFSEIGKFLDTPVKFYSSGMFVRLAFAVAAHLEQEILIVDEVLAVGDAQFQKKSLAKMSSVARSGRTVLFVSHNMSTVLDLCKHAAVLEEGRLSDFGPVESVVASYVRPEAVATGGQFERAGFDSSGQMFAAATLVDETGTTTDTFEYGRPLRVRVETARDRREEFGLEVRIKNQLRQPTAYASSWIRGSDRFAAGDTIEVEFPSLPFVEGTYYLDFICRVPEVETFDVWQDDVVFTIANAVPGASPIRIAASDEIGTVILEDARFTTSSAG